MADQTDRQFSSFEQQADLAARLFKGLADPSRFRILSLLLDGEKNVTELVRLTGSAQGRVSTQLAFLRWCGLVTRRRSGRSIYYRLANLRIRALLHLGDKLIAAPVREPPAYSFVEGAKAEKPTQNFREVVMTYVITSPCIDTMDKSCVDVCPVDCIHFEEGTDRMLYINPDECIDCGACEPACPVKAIYPEDAVPEDMEPFTVINVQWYQDPEAARARVNELKPA